MPLMATAGAAAAMAWASGEPDPIPGQIQWGEGTFTWVVPDNVRKISAVVVYPGGNVVGETPSVGYSGGYLYWQNDIAVIPGETLTIEVGHSNPSSGQASYTRIRRGGTTLIPSGLSTGYPGGSGGSGRGGGGAGGYGGQGGAGQVSGNGLPATDSGGGLGAPVNNDGGGVGLEGRNAGKTPGSIGVLKYGGGRGEGADAGSGGARIMWGRNRSYPDAAINV